MALMTRIDCVTFFRHEEIERERFVGYNEAQLSDIIKAPDRYPLVSKG